ncbi:HNH endonuclease [Nonomuraea sp. NPDC050404]|uniref:HNH endonuclease n=1 Tax=Nonomuraea sp. NPDC050404 TaxID=3155783 RepID=UPI0033CCD3BA
MIRVHRHALPAGLGQKLRVATEKLHAEAADTQLARTRWKAAKSIQQGVRTHLSDMVLGIKSCMYCGDHLSTDIDHFEPLAETPLRAFDWLNHFLACSHCNSHEKRDRFPRDEAGVPLLVDPSGEDPHDHLMLALAAGRYESLTSRGSATIDVFGLNRQDLVDARIAAFDCMCAVLRDRRRLLRAGDAAKAGRLAKSLFDQPFIDVLYTMLRVRHHSRAALILDGPEVVEALADPALDLWSATGSGRSGSCPR